MNDRRCMNLSDLIPGASDLHGQEQYAHLLIQLQALD